MWVVLILLKAVVCTAFVYWLLVSLLNLHNANKSVDYKTSKPNASFSVPLEFSKILQQSSEFVIKKKCDETKTRFTIQNNIRLRKKFPVVFFSSWKAIVKQLLNNVLCNFTLEKLFSLIFPLSKRINNFSSLHQRPIWFFSILKGFC